MLYKKTNMKEYEKEFVKRFTNFCEKAPILLSFVTKVDAVEIYDEVQEQHHIFSWDYSLNVKEFIHAIKEVLTKKCYPKIIHREKYIEDVSIEEQGRLAAEGLNIEDIPTKREISVLRNFLIDKVIVYKDIFILKDMQTGVFYRYKLNKSSIIFLKKLRNKEVTEEQAGEFFFKNSEFLNEIKE